MQRDAPLQLAKQDMAELRAFVDQLRTWNATLPPAMQGDVAFLGKVEADVAAAERAAEARAAAFDEAERVAAAEARLPAPQQKNRKLEREMHEILSRQWTEDEILKVVIVEPRWTTRANTIGRITGRTLRTVVATRQARGCRTFQVTFVQPSPEGTSFGATEYNSVGESKPIACENVR